MGNLLPFAQKLIDELNSATLLAVPYFVIAATFMERGGVARALIDAAAGWVGRLPGGLGLVAVVACTIFAAMCGSSVATAIAMGTILVPAMLRGGYSRGFASGIVGASGTLGILIPPSLAFVVYGVLADISIPRLFLAGVVPGLMQAALLAAYILWYSRRAGYALADAMPVGERLRRTWYAHSGAVGAGDRAGRTVRRHRHADRVGGAVGRGRDRAVAVRLPRHPARRTSCSSMAAAVRNAAVIMIIIAVALAFGHWVTETGLTARSVMMVKEWGIQGWQFLMVINVLLLILGMFLEVYSVMLLVVPVVVPMLAPLGIDPIHFGVVLVINMEIALLTPPVGLNLFVIANISKTPLAEVVRGTMPFVVLMLGLLVLITYVPIFSVWLPGLMMAK